MNYREKSPLPALPEPIGCNKFFKFINDYHNFIRQVKFDFDTNPDKIITGKWIWSKDKQYHVPSTLESELKDLQFSYNNRVGYNQICNVNHDMDQWFKMVREFIVFLDAMEIAVLYKNDKGDSILYVDCDVPNSTFNMYYFDDPTDTEYRISFIDTDIPKPGKQSIIMNYIDATDDEENNTITLIQIDILRRYGDMRTNQLKLVADINTNRQFLQKEEDGLTFNVFRDILSQVIFNTFNDILNNVNKVVGFKRNITEEVLRHGYIKLSES